MSTRQQSFYPKSGCTLIFSQAGNNSQAIWQGEDTREDDCSVSDSSSIPDSHRYDLRIKEFDNPHYNDGECGSNSKEAYHHSEVTGDHSQSDGNSYNCCQQ